MSFRRHGSILILLTLIWGTTWAAIRIGLEALPPMTSAAWRFGLAALALLALARLGGIPLGTTIRERWLWVVVGVLNFAVSYGIVYWAEQYLPSGLTALLFAAFPLFVALLAHFFLPGERLRPISFAGVALGFGGVAMLFGDDLAGETGPKTLLASGVMLLAPLASAVAQIVMKRHGQGVHPLSFAAVPMAICSGLLGLLAWFFERDLPRVWNLTSIGTVIYLALIGSALAFTLYFHLLRQMTATSLTMVAYTTPVVAVALGVTFLDEPLTLRLVLGALAVLAGVALTSLAASRRGSS